jgi:hypothetical protein
MLEILQKNLLWEIIPLFNQNTNSRHAIRTCYATTADSYRCEGYY